MAEALIGFKEYLRINPIGLIITEYLLQHFPVPFSRPAWIAGHELHSVANSLEAWHPKVGATHSSEIKSVCMCNVCRPCYHLLTEQRKSSKWSGKMGDARTGSASCRACIEISPISLSLGF